MKVTDRIHLRLSCQKAIDFSRGSMSNIHTTSALIIASLESHAEHIMQRTLSTRLRLYPPFSIAGMEYKQHEINGESCVIGIIKDFAYRRLING